MTKKRPVLRKRGDLCVGPPDSRFPHRYRSATSLSPYLLSPSTDASRPTSVGNMAIGNDRPPPVSSSSASHRGGGGDGAHSTPSLRLYFVIFWTVLSTFNFGFGTSELNPLQNVLSCPITSPASVLTSAKLPSCIPLTSNQFGYITAAFTVGGFIASLTVSYLRSQLSILKRRDRKSVV